MSQEPDFKAEAAHKFFAASCFNRAWDLLDKTDRTDAEDEEMIRTSLTSLWHWSEREDCTPTNLSIGYWQASRIYAVLGQAENARRYGHLSLEASEAPEVDPLFLSYAYEALARAEAVGGNRTGAEEYLEKARRTAEEVADPDGKKQLLADLESVRDSHGG